MEFLVILAILALVTKIADARMAEQKEQTMSQIRSSGLMPIERAAAAETHEFVGRTCADCGQSEGAARQFGWVCAGDRSALAARLRDGGYEWDEEGKAAFKADLRAHREDRDAARAGREGSGQERTSGGGSYHDSQYDASSGAHDGGDVDRRAQALSVLGLPPEATAEEAKRAWRDLSQV